MRARYLIRCTSRGFLGEIDNGGVVACLLLQSGRGFSFFACLPRRLGVGILDSKSLLEWRWNVFPPYQHVVVNK